MARLAVPILSVLFAALPASSAAAAGLPASWDKGFNFTAWWNDHYASPTAADSLAQMQATNANAVAVIATWYTDDLRSSTIAPRENTPSDASLATIVQRAQAMGLRTLLRPIVDSYAADGWRGDYEPRDPAAWFRTYRRFIYHYAELAQSLGVTTFSVGVELKSMTVPAYSAEWRQIVAGVRARFSGALTYGGVYGDQVDWWDAVDYYGLSWYMSLAASRAPRDNILAPGEAGLGEDQIVARWSSFTDEYGSTHDYLGWLEDRYRRWRKPILFTELGYPSTKESLWAPFSSWSPTRTVDTAVQARAYCAAFRALADKPWVKGVYVWQWLWNDGGIDPRTDTDQSPQNKPAERAIQTWFASGAGVPSRPCRTPRAKTVTALTHLAAQSSDRGHRTRRVRAAGLVRGAHGGTVRLRISRRDASGAWILWHVAVAQVRSNGRFSARIRLPRRGRFRVGAWFNGTAVAAPSHSRGRELRR